MIVSLIWVVTLVVVIDCADLDGNEFCVLQPPDGYWQGRPPGT